MATACPFQVSMQHLLCIHLSQIVNSRAEHAGSCTPMQAAETHEAHLGRPPFWCQRSINSEGTSKQQTTYHH